MKKLKLFDGSDIEVEDMIHDQMVEQWYKNEICLEESKSSYDFYDGGNFFDIGAFNGIYSYILAPKAKNDFFISFEPDQRFFEFIKQSLNALSSKYQNIYNQIIFIPVGNGEAVNYNLPNLGPNGEVGNPCFFGDIYLNSDVKTITIDKYVSDTNIIPSLIKIDVEGAELNVLQGSQNILEKYKPKIILEIHEDFLRKSFNIEPEVIINFLKKFNYKENLNIKNTKVEKILYFE
jgi:FkbM family methyltransferase